MSFEKFVESITPEIYAAMKRAVEIGRWPDGRKLSDEEREQALQAIITYDFRYQVDSDRIGHINGQCTSQRDEAEKSSSNNQDAKPQNLKWC